MLKKPTSSRGMGFLGLQASVFALEAVRRGHASRLAEGFCAGINGLLQELGVPSVDEVTVAGPTDVISVGHNEGAAELWSARVSEQVREKYVPWGPFEVVEIDEVLDEDAHESNRVGGWALATFLSVGGISDVVTTVGASQILAIPAWGET